MLFNSWVFLAFFAVFVAAYAALGRRLRWQNALILVGSYVFYGAWDERFLVLIIASTVCDYLCALGAAGQDLGRSRLVPAGGFLFAGTLAAILPSGTASLWILPFVAGFAVALAALVFVAGRLSAARRRRLFVGFSLCVNLGLLGIFKYYGFFTDNLATLAESAGVTLSMPTSRSCSRSASPSTPSRPSPTRSTRTAGSANRRPTSSRWRPTSRSSRSSWPGPSSAAVACCPSSSASAA